MPRPIQAHKPLDTVTGGTAPLMIAFDSKQSSTSTLLHSSVFAL
jgi:hypothetical protein